MNKKTILLVFAMFGLPVLIATLMHSQWFDWRPGDTRNHGTLIRPVIQWNVGSVEDVFGEPVGVERLENRWFLVLHTREVCDADCLESLYWLRQIRLSQDRHVPDIGLLLIHEPTMPDDLVGEVQALSDAFIMVDGADAIIVAGQFPSDGEESARYILDPMANIIMRYQADQPPDEIRKDLGRLLTWTQSQ
ncbi:MAG TPA: hypothetical protein VIC53_09740 [Wenzhouxiangella sp.]